MSTRTGRPAATSVSSARSGKRFPMSLGRLLPFLAPAPLVGGQAVMEGVMMMNKDRYSVAVRRPDGEIEVKVEQHKPLTKHKELLKVPILRGVFSFADSMIVGMSSLMYSASFYEDEEEEKKKLLLTLKGKENITLDGQKILLYANIGNIKDLAAVMQNDAGGIGLFRSEFIYLEQDHYPTEEEQFRIYKQAAETMAGKRVIIRTLDIGADKQCDYFEMEKEENPALGCRAIRICLTRPEIFKTQLRALFRASAYGKIAIMYPMITSVGEVRQIKAIVEEVKASLAEQGIEYGNPEQGIMIETPAAAIISDELAKEVDFFSIGTNDLSQYTLAIDRQNTKLDPFFDPHHPAILRMIQMVVENAHKAGIWAGICGELGADQELTKEFLAMGVDELSVSPGSILPLRKIILETNVAEYKAGKKC